MNHATNERYGKMAQTFHWLTVLLVLAAFILGPKGSESRVYAPTGSFAPEGVFALEASFQRQLHETLGLCVFALSLMRGLWLLVDKRPKPSPMARWMAIAGKSMQGLLYILLFAVPVTALLGAWLEGHPVTLLAGLEFAPALAKSAGLGQIIANLHTFLGDSILWLAGLHAMAALFHHFLLGDNVLLSMLPKWRSGA